MKTAFLLLLLANVAFFAWTYLDDRRSTESDSPVEREVNEQAIRLLTAAQVAALVDEDRKKGSARTRAQPKPTVTACLELGPFSPSEVSRVQAALDPLALGSRLSRREEKDVASFWVYMPPQRNRQAANQKAVELKKLGVEDFFIVQEDAKFRYAISLGVFKTEEAARARLEELRPKGVRTARIGPREMPVQRTYFTIREVPDALASRLNELRRDMPGSELKACTPEEKRGTAG